MASNEQSFLLAPLREINIFILVLLGEKNE
jgi:hypothetical protein